MSENKESKKQLILRLSPKLWEDLSKWAEDDFRSINGQIEFLLSECVSKRKNLAKKAEKAQRETIAKEYFKEKYANLPKEEILKKLFENM